MTEQYMEISWLANDEEIQIIGGKCDANPLWDLKVSIPEDYQEKGHTVNSIRYSALLANNLKPAIWTKRWSLLWKKVLILHKNARSHSPGQTVETIKPLDFEMMEYLAYSPDVTPSKYHLCGPLKDALRGHRFPKERKQYISAFLTNWKHVSLWSAGPSAVKWKDTIERNYVSV